MEMFLFIHVLIFFLKSDIELEVLISIGTMFHNCAPRYMNPDLAMLRLNSILILCCLLPILTSPRPLCPTPNLLAM